MWYTNCISTYLIFEMLTKYIQCKQFINKVLVFRKKMFQTFFCLMLKVRLNCKKLNKYKCKKHRKEIKIDILLRMSLSAFILKELFFCEKKKKKKKTFYYFTQKQASCFRLHTCTIIDFRFIFFYLRKIFISIVLVDNL